MGADAWEDVDPDEPLVLGEAVGTKRCVFCCMDYEGDESLTVLTPTLRMTLWLTGATLVSFHE
ncbi:unnamed protein product [Lupinus luteus]|uniref:Uncharacterized protein n=1 Tax=Lupinus luteus TaxID=3873 RepID=A0AAV1WJS0_LUPLU